MGVWPVGAGGGEEGRVGRPVGAVRSWAPARLPPMYPRVSDLLYDLFGVESPIPLYSFGLMVATALVVGAWITRRELDRKYALGQVEPVRIKEKDKRGREKLVAASPSVLVWTMIAISAVAGVVGAKLFNIVDFWDQFAANPVRYLFSGSGLTYLGGLLFATLGVAWYARRRGIRWGPLADAIAPASMLGYGIGRIGCYLSGDGDWGVCSDLAAKPSWIPGPLWSETFPNNFLGVDVLTWGGGERGVETCTLPPGVADGVYPTMLYETFMAAVLAGLLWAMRKHPFKAGWLFMVYLVMTGAERFLIEFIRINREWAFGLSQSQWLSIAMMIAGVVGAVVLARGREPQRPRPDATPEPAAA